MQTLERAVLDLLNPPSSPAWLRLQHLHMRGEADISALVVSE